MSSVDGAYKLSHTHTYTCMHSCHIPSHTQRNMDANTHKFLSIRCLVYFFLVNMVENIPLECFCHISIKVVYNKIVRSLRTHIHTKKTLKILRKLLEQLNGKHTNSVFPH